MPEAKEYMFGLADITIGEGENALRFDGKDYLQADGGTLTLTPSFTDFQFADFGETIVERRLSGWEGSISIVVGQEDAKLLELALSTTEPITDTTSAKEVGSMDARIGTRPEGHKVTIHPRILPETDKSQDFVIYKMASIDGYDREYNAEQGNMTITLTMLPRDGFDAGEPGNFFYRGPVDTHATPVVPGP